MCVSCCLALSSLSFLKQKKDTLIVLGLSRMPSFVLMLHRTRGSLSLSFSSSLYLYISLAVNTTFLTRILTTLGRSLHLTGF